MSADGSWIICAQTGKWLPTNKNGELLLQELIASPKTKTKSAEKSAAMETPDDAQYILDHTTCDGFWTGSSTERLPIERAITEAAAEFAALRLPERSSES